MSGTLNTTALKEYATDFTLKILADFYRDRDTISGQEILTLTPVRQVNLGIISRIFDQWKTDAQAFRSPYFDFEKEEVKNALQEFMNTASRHISISRDTLRPLLLDATEEALLLLLAPADYFEQKLRALPNFTFDREAAQSLVKYTHIHAGLAKHLALRLTDSGSDFVYVNQALNWLSQTVSSGASLDERGEYLEQFSTVKPLDGHAIVPDGRPVPVAAAPPRQVSPENKSFFDTALADDSGPVAPPRLPQPVPTAAAPVSYAPTTRVEIARDDQDRGMPTSTGVNSLNSRFRVEIPATPAETNYGNVPLKVDSLLGSIALGQRFMFVNQLFGRNSDAFDEAIRELDQAHTFDDAKELMTHKFAAEYSWDPNSDAVHDLMALVKRKFI